MESVIATKHLWGVSAMALVYRLHTLGVISDWHYRQLCIRLRSQYGSTEPQEMQRETSQVLAKVIAGLRQQGSTRRDMSKDLRIYTRDLDELSFGLVLTPVMGSQQPGRGLDDPGLVPPVLKVI